MSNDAASKEHRYRYLIATLLYRICNEDNDRDGYQHAKAHVDRARQFGMTERAIYERLLADSWYDDQADGDDVFHEDAWQHHEVGDH